MKRDKSKIVVVIPAKSDSGRLPHKNMTLMEGEPLLYYTLKTAKECKLVDKVYVSTDSDEIASYAKKEGAEAIMRPKKLCAETPLLEVYQHALSNIENRDVDYVVGLQPDHPDRTIDLEKVIRYVQEKNLDDLVSVDMQGERNGSIRIMKVEALRKKKLSINPGCVMDKATNIHTLKDLKLAQIRLKEKEEGLTIKIKNKVISNDSPTFIIAEGACNHMCDINLAKKMIDEAEKSGADAIKFQTYKAERLVAKDTKTYWNYGSTGSQYEYYKNLDKFGREEYKELFDYAKDKSIVVFSSPFDIQSADMLNELDMPLFKIASCLVPDKRLIRHIARFKKPVILSTGGSQADEIQQAVDTIYAEDNFSLVIMVCTLSYPAKNPDAHLLRIQTLSRLFPETIIGYSDHTEPDENMVIPAIAVGLGAKIIEKHFTLDRTMTGSGHSFCVDPPMLKKMVQNIRLTEEVMGKEDLGIKDVERKTRDNARMSIVARCNIKKGEPIKEDMLTVKRPGMGISPQFFDKAVGRVARRDIDIDEQLHWDDLG